MCSKFRKNCSEITDDRRTEILNDFYGCGSLQQQREFIGRYVDQGETKEKRVMGTSRRSKTCNYYLPTANKMRLRVCKTLFLSTLNCSEKTVRTALLKLKPSGILEKDQRGGRQKANQEKDEMKRKKVLDHIKKFPRVESHYCRKDTKREYVNADLNVSKMHRMLQETEQDDKISYPTYHRVFSETNLSFHSPQKDQCSLCFTYRKGDEKKKQELKQEYERHIEEKTKVREYKDDCKERSSTDETYTCTVFDLELVIYLPISQISSIFYKRRLSNYNFTVYNIGSKACFCYLWNETISNRGSNEIATFVHFFIKSEHEAGRKTFDFFADGCPGQNKNSIIPAMMLYTTQVCDKIESIQLNFFVSSYGQSEGDSARSADVPLRKLGMCSFRLS